MKKQRNRGNNCANAITSLVNIKLGANLTQTTQQSQFKTVNEVAGFVRDLKTGVR